MFIHNEFHYFSPQLMHHRGYMAGTTAGFYPVIFMA